MLFVVFAIFDFILLQVNKVLKKKFEKLEKLAKKGANWSGVTYFEFSQLGNYQWKSLPMQKVLK